MTTTITDEIREERRIEARLRRAAARQGLSIVKARTRCERSADYSTYVLIHTATNVVEIGPGLSLDDLAAALEVGVA